MILYIYVKAWFFFCILKVVGANLIFWWCCGPLTGITGNHAEYNANSTWKRKHCLLLCSHLVLHQLFHSLIGLVVSFLSTAITLQRITLYAANSELGLFILKLIFKSTWSYYLTTVLHWRVCSEILLIHPWRYSCVCCEDE